MTSKRMRRKVSDFRSHNIAVDCTKSIRKEKKRNSNIWTGTQKPNCYKILSSVSLFNYAQQSQEVNWESKNLNEKVSIPLVYLRMRCA